MALNQTNKLVWIVETLDKAQKLTFEELNRRWMDYEDMSNGEALQKRTFHKWRDHIADTFGLFIRCEKSAPYRYYIANREDIKERSIAQWLLSTLSVSNSLLECKSLKECILLEEVPSGRKYLEPIVDAMKKKRFVHIRYFNYRKEREREHRVMPLCVKLFRQRWYMVGRTGSDKLNMVFCLDRIRDFRLSSCSFDYPEDFVPQEYFNGCIGVIAIKDCPKQNVKIKVSTVQANYLRDLPIHESQQECERTDEYSIFSLQVRPTFDFQQELLWHGENLEVLEPLWLRKEIAGIIKRMWDKYNR